VNDEKIASPTDLARGLGARRAGDEIRINVKRGEESLTVKLQLSSVAR
jgi:S1-C subfamily serine protease